MSTGCASGAVTDSLPIPEFVTKMSAPKDALTMIKTEVQYLVYESKTQ